MSRWWPGEICFPEDIPDNILERPHYVGEFVVCFYGSRDYLWTHRGRFEFLTFTFNELAETTFLSISQCVNVSWFRFRFSFCMFCTLFLTSAMFVLWLFLSFLVFLWVTFDCHSNATDHLERLVYKMTCYVWSVFSFTVCVCVLLNFTELTLFFIRYYTFIRKVLGFLKDFLQSVSV